MPVVSGSSVIRGNRGTPVAQDADDKLIAIMQGSQGVAIAQDAANKLISVMQGSLGTAVTQDAANRLVTAIVGSTGNPVSQDAGDNLIAMMYGSQGTPVAQDGADKLISVMQGSQGNAVAQDATDKLISVIQGSQGAAVAQLVTGELIAQLVGSTGNAIAQDVNDKIIAVMQGDNGVAISQDASNRLEAVLYGDTGVVAQDAANNLISVMKGNYEGALKTWKVDVDGRGEMFLTDPDDIWGNTRIMGLAEHSVRTHAPPLMFDRRGSIIYWDDFESTTRKYANANGTVARVVTRAKTKDASLECITGAGVGNRAEALYMISDFHAASRMGSQVSFSCGDDVFAVGVSLSYYDMTDVHTWSIRLESDGTLQYGNLAGAWVDVAGSDSIYKQNSYNFATIKMVANLSNDTYERAVIFNREYDLSAFTCYSAASPATMPYLYASFTIYTLEAVAKTAYFDNFYLTDNEPDN